MSGTGLTIERLRQAVISDAAIRRIQRLQPVGGRGDKIYPPTYPGQGRMAGPRHVFEHRRVDGANVLCVLVDSVQSQANRLEEGLRLAREAGKVAFPAIAVDFSKTEVADIGRLTTLDVPHRVFDAIIRDSTLNGTRFRDTEEGKRLIQAKSATALAIFELSPTALVFGAWNSTGDGGGLGARFPRAIVSEIVGIGVAQETDGKPSGQRTGSRIDPLGIRSGVKVFKTSENEWSLERPKKPSKDVKEARPSEINHSNIAPTVTPLGVSVDYLLHTFVASCAALRRLHVAVADDGANIAARTTLAALGIAAAVAQDRAGYFLRSRCDLVPNGETRAPFEIVSATGQVEEVSVDFDQACALVTAAAARARDVKLPWRSSDLVLEPRADLVELVIRSREKALKGEAELDVE